MNRGSEPESVPESYAEWSLYIAVGPRRDDRQLSERLHFRLTRRIDVWPGSSALVAHPIVLRHIPLLSYLWLGGRCRACRAPISIRYPLVEATNSLGYLTILWYFGPSWTAALYALLFSALVVVTGTDLTHKMIPNVITIPGMVVGLLGAVTVLPVGVINSVLGFTVGGGILWLLAWLSPYLFGKEGMGGGDIKLLAMVGAFLGWKPALLTIMIGSLTGSIIGISLIALRIIKRDEYIPFGPFLVLGASLQFFAPAPSMVSRFSRPGYNTPPCISSGESCI